MQVNEYSLAKSDSNWPQILQKKLVFKMKKYDSFNDTDEYMMMLTQGGYIVGKKATLLFPDGIDVLCNTT